MHPINRAITHIEAALDREVRLDEVERNSHISRFHLSRVFAMATGYPPIEYHRLRRLTEAAKRLGEGSQGILEVALDAGYGSHSSFTRAFVSRFGVSPKAFKEDTSRYSAKFVEPIYWSEQMSVKVSPPRIESGLDLTLVGLQASFTYERSHEAADLWPLLDALRPQIPNIIGQELCGVFFNPDWERGTFDYFMGYPVSATAAAPSGLSRKRATGEKFAVFTYDGDTDELDAFIVAVVGEWLPGSELEVVDGSHVQRIKTTSSQGGQTVSLSELWIPVR